MSASEGTGGGTRSRKRRQAEEARISLTPMIDVVFQLIIFFMLVGEFQAMELEQITLPNAISGEIETGLMKRVVVNITADGEVRVMRKLVSAPAFSRLIGLRGDHAGRDQRGNSELNVKIRADAECPYGRVQQVLSRCSENQVYHVSFGAHQVSDESAIQ